MGAVAPATPADNTPPAKDWTAENAAANARAGQASSNGSAAYPGGVAGLRRTTPSAAAKSDKQIVAECEAGHGARCNSSGEIAQRRMEQRQLPPSEQKQQQQAVAARRQREADEAFNRGR